MLPGRPRPEEQRMGLLSASTTVVRFVAPAPRLDRDALARAVSRRAFRELDPDGGDTTQSCGWVGVHDPLATALTAADLFFQDYLVVGFRYDRRAVPAKLLYLERRRAEAALKTERGTERLGSAARKQIKTEVEARLLLRALPAPRLFDCVWNLATGRVYFTGKLRAAREAFVDLFRQTFGVAPVPLIPYLAAEHVELAPRVVEAVRAVEPASFVPVGGPERGSTVPHLPLESAEVAG
jgi:recombination associated protein RdgC